MERFTRVDNDTYGNPRCAIHFLDCEPKTWADYGLTLAERYARTVKLMNKIGGRKFHNKQYGGGIVFLSYDIRGTIEDIEKLKGETK